MAKILENSLNFIHHIFPQMACPGSPNREDVSRLDQIIKNTG